MTSAIYMQKLSVFLCLYSPNIHKIIQMIQKGTLKFMLTSIALIFLLGLFLGWVFSKINLPSLLGMIVTGVIIGPYVLNLIDPSILGIAPDLRQIALVIILTRAGLSLNIKELKKVGRPAFLMCFIPATLEILATTLIAPALFGISYLEAGLIGATLAAVSPAVIVPRMLKVMGEGYGVDKQIPQIILAGSSADDVYVIVVFSSLIGVISGEGVSLKTFMQMPISILLGIGLGLIVGLILSYIFKKMEFKDSTKLILLMCISFLLITVENISEDFIKISGLIAIMVVGMSILAKAPELALKLSSDYKKLWVGAEIVLFVLVGTAVNTDFIPLYGARAILLIFSVLIFRMLGVFLCLIKTKLNKKERLFCMIAYTPKATVQAAIGAIPIAMGFECGGIVLTVAVLSILVTAPLGAFLVDLTYRRLLSKS